MKNLIKYGLFCTVFGTAEHIAATTGAIDDATLAKADIDGNWLTYGGNYQEDRYSTLDQINKEKESKPPQSW